MPNKMLIDASHPEETRVVVTRGNRIEEFDFESQDKKQLRGNIYLARVTRVEPSLQAAFVEYGGNRHGFLAFSEIHPDYYQIPVADRQALLKAEAEAAEADDDEDEDNGRRRKRGGRNRGRGQEERQASAEAAPNDEAEDAGETEAASEAEEQPSTDADEPQAEAFGDMRSDAGDDIPAAPADTAERPVQPGDPHDEQAAEQPAGNEASDDESSGSSSTMLMAIDGEVVSEPAPEAAEAPEAVRGVIEEVSSTGGEEGDVESVGAEDALEEVQARRKSTPRRHYKIQEVVKRRQILLVQVVKEERGNKGAALTTYLSLAGRYSVLMPNTARGGGISRKITSAQDRKRLKEVMRDLDVPQGMGVILRTAGENRTKAEIKRDYEYLMRLWENVRTLTLKSTAPALVYEEGSLIKRSVRDLYNKDIDEILVAGEDAYREAKDFMRMLMPSHAKVVQPYRDPVPIFARNGIEAQLDKMLQPQVTLKSGGYIIINQTEALVSIDVNSGRSTREHSIEDTALQTNLEAAEEVARQLRLRDLAGLIVIDFIDMEEGRNNRAVEKKLKDCLKNDRARIQVGRISHFGLLEMSRQRMRTGMLESTTKPCPHCGGTGHVRSDSSVALLVVRAIEEFLLKDSRHHIAVRTSAHTALYVLNHKRSTLVDFERRFGVAISFETDEAVGAQHYLIVKGAVAEKPLVPADVPVAPLPPLHEEPETGDVEEEVAEDASAEEDEDESSAEGEEAGEGGGDRKRRRRRRRRGGREREHGVSTDAAVRSDGPEAEAGEETDEAEEAEGEAKQVTADADAAHEGGEHGKKRRRGKRGGRRNRRDENAAEEAAAQDHVSSDADVDEDQPEPAAPLAAEVAASTADLIPEDRPASDDEAPVSERQPAQAEEGAPVAAAAESEPQLPEAPANGDGRGERPRPSRRRGEGEPAHAPAEPVVSVVVGGETVAATELPKRSGWWSRKSAV
ncbi:MAG TPA: ribonuclease E/G [Mesorhizobium sp.]|jgi:ribonuclease E|nr:ribonuclease E/G [Mesorhizobium sp.]